MNPINKILVFSFALLFLLTGVGSVYAESWVGDNIANPSKDHSIGFIYDKYKDYHNNRCTPKISTLVDDEEWDIIVPHDYNSIQEAINNAKPYYTILVKSGVYYENLIVDVNALNIIGEDSFLTIVDGKNKGSVFEVKAFLVSISGFYISNSTAGVSFEGFSPTFNNIYGNNFYNNQKGIEITGRERSNNIYQNNFIGNQLNAFDPTENNFWYDTNNMIGNYWDDYTGEDTDNNGIGDTPYYIPGDKTADMYPLINPYCFDCRPIKPSKPIGQNKGKINQTYSYRSSSADPSGGKLFYWFEWGDGTNSSWIGPYMSGEECEILHTWYEKGSYDIRVRAKNEDGIVSLWSEPLSVSMSFNKQNTFSFIYLFFKIHYLLFQM